MVATKTVDLRHMIKRCPDCGQQYSTDSVFCPFDGSKLQDSIALPKVDPLIGTVIDDRYEVLEVIGEGGMGTVYAVKHKALDRSFALKALRIDLARDGELAERFIREAKATAAIKHPQVVSISDFGALPDGRPYFVMERLVGQTLAQVTKRGGALPAARASAIAIKVARALAAAHEAGVVHRDLKPENVFLLGRRDAGPEQDVRVVDFGAAMIVGKSRLTKKGIVFGTPFYMSPEQASGGVVDHRADVYALGVIMYEMFTGRVPFEGDSYMGVLTQHMFVEPVPPSRLDPKLARELGALETITLKCLEKQPEKRFASMEELALEVEKVVSVDANGITKVAPYLDAGDSRGEPRIFGMADSLELPTASELRGRMVRVREDMESDDRARKGRVLLPIAVVALVFAVGLLIWKLTHSEPTVATAPVATTSASVVPVVSAPAPVVSAPHAIRDVALVANVPCDVYLGSALVGKTPLELRVAEDAPAAMYVLKADGYLDQQVVVGATTTERLDVTLQKKKASPTGVSTVGKPPKRPLGDPFATDPDPWK